MTHTIYALLVGIDQYASPRIPGLQGCVNDITTMKTFLHERAGNEDNLQIVTLKNSEATREAIINQFRTHLCQAESDDVALFYYSGHGSQERTAPEFWQFEPDKLDETIVCYDSRTPDHYDLADKELAKLMAEIAQRNPHIVILLDSCHSGSGTRNTPNGVIRRISMDERLRPLKSFIVTPSEVTSSSATRNTSEAKSDWINLPQGKHILMAACHDYQTAKELPFHGQHRGVFSYFLMDALQRTGCPLTYRDLFKRVEARVQNQVQDQSPVIEVSDISYLSQPFLGGDFTQNTYFTLKHDKGYGWVIDGGSVHGIPPITDGETTTLVLFPFDSTPEELHELPLSLGTARVTEVLPQLSRVSAVMRDGQQLNPEQTYKAVVTSLPLTRLGVLIEGDDAGVQLARRALATANFYQQSSLYVREVEATREADLLLRAHNSMYHFLNPATDRLLVASISGYSETTAKQAVQRLEHMARWKTIAKLTNETSRLAADAIQMEFHRIIGPPATRTPGSEPTEPYIGPALRLEYVKNRAGKWEAPKFKMRLKNMSNERLYCALLLLSETYAVKTDLLLGRGVWLNPEEEAWALGGRNLKAQVLDEQWQQGITESRDLFKLIVSTEEFDAMLLDQEELDIPLFPRSVRGLTRNTLNRLLSRVRTRIITVDDEDTYTDWTTSEISLTVVRPLDAVPVPSPADPPASLSSTVHLEPHPYLQGRVCLITVPQAGRDLGNLFLPPLLRDHPEITQPFQFTVSHGSNPGLSGLELFSVADYTAVTPEQPLVLQVDAVLPGSRDVLLAENEHILPFGYDCESEAFLPLGRASHEDGKIRIELQRLPAPFPIPAIGDRNLTGSIRIFFQKVVSQSVGLPYGYPLLAIATVTNDGTVTYTKDLAEVRTRVANAERILLYIHGIIGDTLGMASSARCPYFSGETAPPSLADRYDLILTFDYENLNTSIPQTAQELKRRLLEAGLLPDHRKKLDIVAHSMGGLVSRWFIEREGGNKIVRRLVMLGTPNSGSPWPKLEHMATALLTIGLNSLSVLSWSVDILPQLICAFENLNMTMGEMIEGSSVLEDLSQSSDPHVPYAIIAGNTSLSPAATELLPGQERSRFALLMQRLLSQNLWHRLAGLAFFDKPNDIAVSVESIAFVPTDRSPQPHMREVACDHLTYFMTEVGLKALAEALDSDSW